MSVGPLSAYYKCMSARSLIDTITHRFIRVPYSLHYEVFQSPKKPKATFIFIHGIGNTLHSWDDVAARLPKDVRAIGVDLLGFGESPKPSWAVYSAKTQARSVGLTIARLGLTQKPIVVGHSLGALVAVDVARRYPFALRQLVLCSPPFYHPELKTAAGLLRPYDDVLRELYRTAKKHPEQLEHLSVFAVKLGLANKSLNITNDNITSYIAALESSIINQTSLQDIANLRLPITIFYGLDIE